MEFALSAEQRLLEQTLRQFLERECPPARVRELVGGSGEPRSGEGAAAARAALWKEVAKLGLAGLLVPEPHGGAGLGLLDAAVAAESLAWGAAPAPFLGSAVMAPVALRAGGSPAQQQAWLPRLAAGECRIGVAATELVSRREDAGLEARGGRISGRALMVIDALDADHFLVAVGDAAPRLALVAADAPGLELAPLLSIDRTRGFGELVLDAVSPLEWLGEGAAEPMLRAAHVALAADLLGASERAFELAVAYAKQREQFGRVIGSFQAVKHLCAEMAAELEPARALVWYAAYACDALPEEAALAALHAKAHLSEVGPSIVRTATEVHGGIGFTDEHNLHYWFKRAGVDRQLLGGPERLRARAARLQGFGAARE